MPRRAMTIGQGVRRIIVEHYKGTKSEKDSTARLYQVAELLGMDTPLKDIDERDISEIKTALLALGNSSATVNRKLSAFSKMLRTACEEWLEIPRMPAVKLLKEEKAKVHLLTHDEEAQMLEFFREKGQPLMVSMVICLVDTGCRLSEMIRLHAKDIDWDNRLMTARDTKNGEPVRIVPMTDRVVKELRYLVVTQGELTPFREHRNWYQRRWNKARDWMGFPAREGFKMHCLRHTCATRLLKAGVKIEVVAEWLGHSTLDMTRRYYRFIPDDLSDAVKILQGAQSH